MYPHVLRLLADLRRIAPDDPSWMRVFREFRDGLGHLFYVEEHELFSEARRILSRREATRLADELEELWIEAVRDNSNSGAGYGRPESNDRSSCG
jgi:hypothetical protein